MKKALVATAVFFFNFLTFIIAEFLVVFLLLSIRLDPGNRQIFLPVANALHPLRFILPLLWGLVGAWVAYRWIAEKEQIAFYLKMEDLTVELKTIGDKIKFQNLPLEKAEASLETMTFLSNKLGRLAIAGPGRGTSFLDILGTPIRARSTPPRPAPTSPEPAP